MRVAWLTFWFVAGQLTYMLMRAHFQVRGPRPLATGYKDLVKRAWGPLMFRFCVENAIFQCLLNPQLAPLMLHGAGWDSFANMIETVVKFGPITYMMGTFGDVILDFGIVKLPVVRDVFPQMPPPLPQPTIVQSAVVEQTTKVTALETKTTIGP